MALSPIDLHASVLPSVESARRANPDTPVAGRQYGRSGRAREPRVYGERANRRLTKLVETLLSSDPNGSFTVFEKGDNQITGQAVGLGKQEGLPLK